MRHGMKVSRQTGYAMAALLVAMSIMAVMLTVAMPVWKQASQREKEEELIFRGLQYAHAIGMFQRKYANAAPPSVDVLVNERFLRRKYKDPVTNDDFALILAGQNAGAPGGSQAGGAASAAARGQTPRGALPGVAQPGGPGRPVTGGPGGGPVGGIIGVSSKSKDKSIRLYNGRSHYNEWQFVYTPQVQAPGAGAPGTAAPGQPQRGTGGFPGPGGPIGSPRGGGGRGQPPQQPTTTPRGRF
jgi:type II secretory pathway pseudopilin PulG